MTFRSTFSMASVAATFVLLTTSTAYAARIAHSEEVTGQCVTMRVRFTEFLCRESTFFSLSEFLLELARATKIKVKCDESSASCSMGMVCGSLGLCVSPRKEGDTWRVMRIHFWVVATQIFLEFSPQMLNVWPIHLHLGSFGGKCR